MADFDFRALVPPWIELEIPERIDSDETIKRLRKDALAAVKLDPPGSDHTAPGHRAGAGLVIAVGNYIRVVLGLELGEDILAAANDLLDDLELLPPTHGFRWH